MKAVCLLVVFILARILILAGRDIPMSPWTPFVYLWQDLLVVLMFAALNYLFRRRTRIGWTMYGLITLYTAVNVPITCVLSTPLTWPLIRATRGALADSIAYHVTIGNILRINLVLAAGLLLPLLLRRLLENVRPRTILLGVLAALVCLPLGWLGSTRIETLGLHRNVLTVLVTTALPRIASQNDPGDWRRSPFGSPRAEDLSSFRGAAYGRNVVVVHLESTGARYLHSYGAAENPMPHLTEMTQQAILFENAYTTYPETIRSFFATQCGRFPAMDTEPEAYAHVSGPALAAVLSGAGYRTGLFHSGRFMYLGMESVIRGQGYQTLEDASDIGGDHESSFGIDEPSTVRRILRWIDAGPGDRPFLVSYLPIAGHHPYETPEAGPFSNDREIDCYRNALHYSDAALGQLIEGLRRRGLYDKTLFVIFGDHGEAFGQHPGNYGHTLFVHEENIRVPYMIAAPGLIYEPIRVHRVASLVDTFPTILDLLGYSIPDGYQGRSLLNGQTNLALFCTDYSLGFLGLRDERWKAIYQIESNQTQLYDLENDPDEMRDLAGRFPERVETYRNHLQHWAAAQKYLITAPRN